MIHGDCKCHDCERERENERKRGMYWLTAEGRAEIRDIWFDERDLPRVLLAAVEAREAEAARLRDVLGRVLRGHASIGDHSLCGPNCPVIEGRALLGGTS